MPRKRRICFVTGTRAEFGLMQSTLAPIDAHPKLELQLIVTGMHLSRRHGRSVQSIQHRIDAIVPWKSSQGSPLEGAQSTGVAIAALAKEFDRLQSDVVLVVGDRIEAFAAASAGHICGKIVAHIHGGDRALGQVDDSLRHAITKLSHLHFAATKQSAQRIAKLGEDRVRIHTVGAPGIDGILKAATPSPCTQGEGGGEGSALSQANRRAEKKCTLSPALSLSTGRGREYALLVLHPVEANDAAEYRRAKLVLEAIKSTAFPRIVIIHPNNDPGSRGIARCWDDHARGERFVVYRNLDRSDFLGLMRDASVLIGNSSSGIIEAASFGTPVIDIGPRQLGRERSGNVTNVPYGRKALLAALKSIWNDGRPKRYRGRNVYGGDGAGHKIAMVLSSTPLNDSLRRKLITY